MKSFEQLAQSAYLAYVQSIFDHPHGNRKIVMRVWIDLDYFEQQAWISAAKQLWAEFAPIH